MTVASSTNWQVMGMGMPQRRPVRRVLWPNAAVLAVTIMASALSSQGGRPTLGGDYLAQDLPGDK